MKKLVLGLDIGITSVGYGVIDIENNTFVDYGVRLFKEGTAENNLTRRTRRSARRLLSRRKNRLQDMKALLTTYQMIEESYSPCDNPYRLRKKGLSAELTNNELVNVILHITKKRGSSIETVEENDEESKENEKVKGVLQENKALLQSGKHICEIQLERMKNNGKVKGESNNFKTTDYVKELKDILKQQNISQELQDKIIEIVERRRQYYEGPGSKKSPTPYGRYYIDEDGELQYIDLIEKMRGKCSVYPDELRAPKMSYSAEIFNMLNDLNNLTISQQRKLTAEEKQEVLEVVHNKGNITPKQLAKLLTVDIEDISGFRIDKNSKPLLTECKGYKIIKKLFVSYDALELIEDKEVIDTIVEILTRTKGIEERYTLIKEKYPFFNSDILQELASTKGISDYHSLSFKIIRELNTELLQTELNQRQLLHQLDMFDKHRKSTKGEENIYADDEAILSPIAKRAQRETFKVINKLRKIHGEFDTIVVETTRDKNNREEKNRITKNQKYHENKNKELNELLDKEGFDSHQINGKTKTKIRLYLEQEGKSAYTFQPLDLRQIINDKSYCEIDHIIPISISLDDSLNNKVLTTHKENQQKGNQTPIYAYMNNKFAGMGCDLPTYKIHTKNSKLNRKKKEYLLYEKDITKFSNIKEFINRNLVDTSYANRVVMNTLTTYFKDNDIATKVHTIRGSATSKMRNIINLSKERDENHLHHAVDALLVASIKKMNLFNTYLSKYNFDELYDEKTGEIIKIPDTKEYLEPKYIEFITTLKNIYAESVQYISGVKKKQEMQYNPIKVSHKIDTKPNRQVADDTIYSTRTVAGVEKVIGTYRDIYDPKLCHICEDILNDNEEKYLMAKHNPQTFSIIKDIIYSHFEMFKGSKEYYVIDKDGKVKLKGVNPLSLYQEEHGEIHKYAKKNNGPAIKAMKYYDHVLGNHIDITRTDTPNAPKNKRVLLKQISPYRTDFYQSPDGKYAMVTIRYKDIKYMDKTKEYSIDTVWYQEEKDKKKIADNYHFVCSLHHDELLGITKKKGSKLIYNSNNIVDIVHDGITPEILKFTATNNDTANRIEVNSIYCYCTKRLMPAIGTFIKLEKYACDVLGNIYKVKDSTLKLSWK